MPSNSRPVLKFLAPAVFLTTLSLLFATDRSGGVISMDANFREPRETTVVFYNVENLFDTINDPNKRDDDFTPEGKYGWDTARYFEKLDNLAKAIAGADDDLPALVGICETENAAVLEDLILREPLKRGKYGVIHFESLDERGIDVALLYRKKIFSPDRIETLFVNLGPDARPTREILYVNGYLNGGPLLHVFVNHWPSRYRGTEATEPARKAAAQVLRDAVDAVIAADQNAAVLILGDFNDYPHNASVREVLNAKRPDESGLLVNLMYGAESTHRGTYNYRGEWGFLDQIIVSRSMHEGGAIMVKPESARPYHLPGMLVTKDEDGTEYPHRSFRGTEYTGGYSDHLPVRAVLWH